ncbi:MAG: SIS domain-containing protein [Anaerolineae bacterium]|nr:SIS domain-containing protein [Anaerolineae bacterium]
MLVGLAVARAAGGVSTDRLDAMEAGLLALPGLASQALAAADAPVRALAAQCAEATGMFFIGNGPNYALALEGMLKARECAGVHADGIPANEMRHGYMNAVRGAMPVAFLIGPPGRGHQSVASIARTLGRLPATLIALGREGDWDLRGVADTFVGLPFDVDEFLAPVAYAPAIQLFVVYLGMARGQNVDHPAESEMVGSYREVDGRLVYYIDKFE